MRHFTSLILALLLIFPAKAQETRETIKVDGATREMLVYVPRDLPDYAPLVISMHGMNQDAAYQKGMANWAAVADTAKFVVVYPEGEGKSWDIGGDKDTHFIEAIIEDMFQKHAIDKRRVYLSGFSMGGMMTYHAASRIADKIAAMAPISGYAMGGDAYSPRPIPVIHTHGTDDDVVAYSGARPYIEKWVAIDGCDRNSVYTKPYHGKSNASLEVWTNHETGVEVALLTLDGKGHWVSMDASCVLTSCEIWNFCKRYTLDGPIEAIPPKLLSASPADNSFDLPVEGVSFQYSFNQPILCDTVYALLKGGYAERIIRPDETGASNVITFTIKPGDAVPAGDYRLSLVNVIDTCGGDNEKCSFTYYLGVEEVTGEFVYETILKPDWMSQKDQIGEGIPEGWMRVTYSKGKRIEKGQNEANVAGARMQYFNKGGDMDAAFYLAARDAGPCSLIYGTYQEHLLHLKPGKYAVSFNSAYWNSSAQSNSMTYSLTVRGSSDNTVLEVPEVPSSGMMNEIVYQKVTGSKANRYEFYVYFEDDYVLEFTTDSGWDGVVIGNILIETAPSYAYQYKVRFLEAMSRIRKAYTQLVDYGPAFSQAMISEMSAAMDRYNAFRGNTGQEYEAAVKEINDISEQAEIRVVNLSAYLKAFNEGKALLDMYADNEEIRQGRPYMLLERVMSQYGEEFAGTASTFQLWEASDKINSQIESFKKKTDVDEVAAEVTLVSEIFYGLDGKVEENPVKGVYLSKRLYSDGRTIVTKRLF